MTKKLKDANTSMTPMAPAMLSMIMVVTTLMIMLVTFMVNGYNSGKNYSYYGDRCNSSLLSSTQA
jgi:hypothetical protein